MSRVAWQTWRWGPVHAALVLDFVVLSAAATYATVRAASVNKERKKQVDMASRRHMQLSLAVRQHDASVGGLQTPHSLDGQPVTVPMHDPAAGVPTSLAGSGPVQRSSAEIAELRHTAGMLGTVVASLPSTDKAFELRLLWLPVTRRHAAVMACGFASVWVALVLAELPLLQ